MQNIVGVQKIGNIDTMKKRLLEDKRTAGKAAASANTAQYVFFGSLGAVISGLADVGSALHRQSEAVAFGSNLTGLCIGLGALVPFGGLLGFFFALIATRFSLLALLSKLKRPLFAGTALAGVVVAGGAVLYVGYRRGILIDAVDFRAPLFSLLALATLTGGVVAPPFQKRTYTKAAVLLIALSMVIFVAALSGISSSRDLPRILSADTVLVGGVFNGMRSVLDSDKDGFPRSLCTTDCDCDDANPKINPAATDIPGNSIDEDCSGKDLPVLAAAPKDPGTESANSQTIPPAFSPPMNIVLITIDTLRADRMHVYGHDRMTTPNLDLFAAENVRFAEVRSQGSSTRHVFPVFLTGRYFPTIHQSKGKKWWTLLDSNTTFGEILKDNGYRTVAVLPYFRFKEKSGFQQGFDVWETVVDANVDSTWSPTGELVTKRGIEHLETLLKTEGPWLLWLHYFDPHASYIKHDDQQSFGNERADLYDGEVLYVDKQVGKFFDVLKTKGLWDTTGIVVTSDHGEGIGLKTDHGFNYHGFSLYDSETRVPLMIRAPGMQPRVVDQCVALIDLPPTLLTLGGAKIPNTMHGLSLIPYAFGSTEKRPPFLMHLPESNAWEAIVDWPYKLIWEQKPNRFQLFNLVSDPNEQTDIAAQKPDIAERLKDRMRQENYRLENESDAPSAK